ncbi:hypothetical protein Tco_0666896, partial [Tanacetum coccineum]
LFKGVSLIVTASFGWSGPEVCFGGLLSTSDVCSGASSSPTSSSTNGDNLVGGELSSNVTLTSSSPTSSLTNGDNLVGGGLSSNVTLSDFLTFMVYGGGGKWVVKAVVRRYLEYEQHNVLSSRVLSRGYGGGGDGEGGLERFSRGVIGDNDRVISIEEGF